jgi:hypothetical protein
MTTGAYLRRSDRSVHRLDGPITTDLLGSEPLYYAVVGGVAHASTSVRALCRLVGRVTLDPLALAETLAFGLPLREATVVNEVRSVPPHATLHPDGTVDAHAGPRSTGAITDAAVATRRIRGLLDEIVRAEEARFEVHCVGYTGGKDSRILAALPKAAPDRWRWLSVSGRDDAEHVGSTLHARRLGLAHHAWIEWTSDFLVDDSGAEPPHRVSADLANGIGAISDTTLLRRYFEEHCRSSLGRSPDDAGVALWIGALADGLFAGTYLPPAAPAATTLWDALAPRTAHLPNVLSPSALERFLDFGAFYRSNPLAFAAASDEEVGFFIRLLTRGRLYVCRLLSCFDRVCPTQVNPYLHPSLVELALAIDPRLRAADALRDGVLAALGEGLDAPSAFGYRAPAYSRHVLDALTDEARRCAMLDGAIAPALLDALREGRFPDLTVAAPDGASDGAGKPSYRSHAGEPPNLMRSLRDYEHLLTYTTFLNLLVDDGVLAASSPPHASGGHSR